MSRPVVVVSVPHGASAGNVLRTGLVQRLLDTTELPEVVLISPLVNDAAFAAEFCHPRVHFVDLPPHRPAGLEARLMALVQAGYIGSGVTESVRIRHAEAAAKRTIRFVRTKRLLTSIAVPAMVRPRTRYDLIDRLVAHPQAERLFDRYAPSLLVVSSPGLILAEVPLLRTAVRRGVRSIAIDPSWDNFTNQLLPVRRVDRLIVWNELMKEQAIDLHGYRAEEVRVAGTPQWDLYFRPGPVMGRDTFFQRIGADPARKLVTLTTTPRELYSHHDQILRVMIRAISAGRWPCPAQILVRLHPRDDRAAYAAFENVPHVIIEKRFRSTVRTGDGLDVDVTADNQRHLADTLRHTAVIVNVGSTIAIEAAIFDTPVVNDSFDGETPSPWVKSARRYYRFTHYVNITRHGAVRVAETPDSLVEEVGRYLADRSRDREGRRRVVVEQCQYLDGRSAERVARVVADELAAVCGTTQPRVSENAPSRQAV